MGQSPLDGTTETWSKNVTASLLAYGRQALTRSDFAEGLVLELEEAPRAVRLLALELLILAITPVGFGDSLSRETFRRFRVLLPDDEAVTGGFVPSTDLWGYRRQSDSDVLPERLWWCIVYAERYGSSYDRGYLLESDQPDYASGFRLPDLAARSPWAAAELASLVPIDCPGMRHDLDHMLWPEFLPPHGVRRHVEEIVAANREILRGGRPGSELELLQHLYLAKQLWGGWDQLAGLRGTRAFLSALRWEDSW